MSRLDDRIAELRDDVKGGKGSGNWAHGGLHGTHGGSGEDDVSLSRRLAAREAAGAPPPKESRRKRKKRESNELSVQQAAASRQLLEGMRDDAIARSERSLGTNRQKAMQSLVLDVTRLQRMREFKDKTKAEKDLIKTAEQRVSTFAQRLGVKPSDLEQIGAEMRAWEDQNFGITKFELQREQAVAAARARKKQAAHNRWKNKLRSSLEGVAMSPIDGAAAAVRESGRLLGQEGVASTAGALGTMRDQRRLKNKKITQTEADFNRSVRADPRRTAIEQAGMFRRSADREAVRQLEKVDRHDRVRNRLDSLRETGIISQTDGSVTPWEITKRDLEKVATRDPELALSMVDEGTRRIVMNDYSKKLRAGKAVSQSELAGMITRTRAKVAAGNATIMSDHEVTATDRAGNTMRGPMAEPVSAPSGLAASEERQAERSRRLKQRSQELSSEQRLFERNANAVGKDELARLKFIAGQMDQNAGWGPRRAAQEWRAMSPTERETFASNINLSDVDDHSRAEAIRRTPERDIQRALQNANLQPDDERAILGKLPGTARDRMTEIDQQRFARAQQMRNDGIPLKEIIPAINKVELELPKKPSKTPKEIHIPKGKLANTLTELGFDVPNAPKAGGSTRTTMAQVRESRTDNQKKVIHDLVTDSNHIRKKLQSNVKRGVMTPQQAAAAIDAHIKKNVEPAMLNFNIEPDTVHALAFQADALGPLRTVRAKLDSGGPFSAFQGSTRDLGGDGNETRGVVKPKESRDFADPAEYYRAIEQQLQREQELETAIAFAQRRQSERSGVADLRRQRAETLAEINRLEAEALRAQADQERAIRASSSGPDPNKETRTRTDEKSLLIQYHQAKYLELAEKAKNKDGKFVYGGAAAGAAAATAARAMDVRDARKLHPSVEDAYQSGKRQLKADPKKFAKKFGGIAARNVGGRLLGGALTGATLGAAAYNVRSNRRKERGQKSAEELAELFYADKGATRLVAGAMRAPGPLGRQVEKLGKRVLGGEIPKGREPAIDQEVREALARRIKLAKRARAKANRNRAPTPPEIVKRFQ